MTPPVPTEARVEVGEVAKVQMYRVIARTHMNFAPNQVDRLPPGDNYTSMSDPVTYDEACKMLPKWKGVCQDRWRVTMEPIPGATP